MDAVSAVARQHGGSINYLMNCAVYFGSKGITAEPKDWDKTFAVNARGYAKMVQACLDPMKSIPGRNGKAVVNVASVAGYVTQPSRWTYSSSKGAVHTMTKCMHGT